MAAADGGGAIDVAGVEYIVELVSAGGVYVELASAAWLWGESKT
jgi:hypothetical protein